MMTPANPIACNYCGGRHGHSMWCARPSVAERWRDSLALIDALVATMPDGKTRGRLRSKLMAVMRECVRENEDEATQQQFADLMYAAGYHRPQQ